MTAGPTRESIDPGAFYHQPLYRQDGICHCQGGSLQGRDVTLVSGPVDLPRPLFCGDGFGGERQGNVRGGYARSRGAGHHCQGSGSGGLPACHGGHRKIKKSDGDLSIALERTDDILGWLGQNRRDGQFLCGIFHGDPEYAGEFQGQAGKKHIDMIVANNLKVEGADSARIPMW